MSDQFCIDTSFFINGWNKYYWRSVFPSLWTAIEESLEGGQSYSCWEVFEEIKKQRDELFEWANARKGRFEKPGGDVIDKMSLVMAEFPNFAAQGGSTNAADPWVIAHSIPRSAIVITDERYDTNRKSTRPPAIPNVCEKLGLKYMAPVEYLAAIGIVL